MTMIQQAACGQRGVASMTITTFLGRLIQTQSHLRPCSASASWRAHSMMTSPSPRKRNCQSLAVTTNSLPMKMDYISGNSMRSAEFLNPMNCRYYCKDGGGHCGGCSFDPKQHQQRRRRWHQRQYRQRGQLTTSDRRFNAPVTVQDCMKLISRSTTMASSHRNFQYYHHPQQNEQHHHQRTFSSSQTPVIADRYLNEQRVGDGLVRHADVAESILSIQEHLDKLHTIPLENIRNFCIIAHVDHGKSSLASRILEYTGNLGRERQCTAYQLEKGSDDEDCENGGEDDAPAGDDEDSNANNITRGSISGSEPTDSKEEITILDTLAVERERGITVRASAASMLYRHPSKSDWILLNMVDTPGHVDFGMEVGKSLDGVEGAILLIDSARGVQAQTLSVYDKAKSIGRQRRKMRNMRRSTFAGENELASSGKSSLHGDSDIKLKEDDGITGDIRILPALTKVDMPSARPLEVALAVSDLLGFDPDEILKTSARTRIGIKEVLDAICERVHPPEPLPDDDGEVLRAKVIDSWFESKRGVIALVRILSGKVEENDRISIIEPASYEQIADGAANAHTAQKDNYSVQEVGLMMPHRIRTGKLTRGQMGYVIAGLRDPREARPGVILSLNKSIPTLMNGMTLPPSVSMGKHSVLYASVHPVDGDGFDELFAAVSRLALSDSGLEIQQTAGSSNSSGSGGGPFLGPGLRVGFQGLLHVEVFRQRLEDEFNMEAIVTPPKVPYTIQFLPSKNYHRSTDLPMEVTIEDLIDWPPQGNRFKVLEPMVNVRVLAPMEYAGNIMELIKRKRGAKMETKPIDEHSWQILAVMPWAEVVTDFHDELKSTSTGYASFDVSEADPPRQESNLCKVEIMLNNEVVDPLSFVCHVDAARSQARVVCEKLQDVLPRQQFVTVIQAKADGKIIASERIRAYRKDVLTKSGKTVGGGDITRKKKLLEKQKQGKKKSQATGKVTLSQEAFRAVISRSS